ncbi:MAG: helix-turn-helix domain-containing protein [Alphaproteobacteria bacterium]
MTLPGSTAPVAIALVAVPEASAAVIYGLHEVFLAVGTVWEQLTGAPSVVRRMAPQVVAGDRAPFRTAVGAPVVADLAFAEAARPDIVIVADLTLDAGAEPAGRWPEATAWLRRQHARGAIVCSVCTGALMLAEAGLLDGREATTHWSAGPLFRRCYPRVLLQPERVLVPAGAGHGIVTSGGSASWADLALYLIARFCGEDEARRIAKVFLFGDRSHGQLPFAAMVRPARHDDAVIADCQAWIAQHYATANPVARMAGRSGLNGRTFKRRFRRATGYAPLDYVQTLRIEEAKQMLETGDAPIDAIAGDVGYDDPGSFRRLFKRTTGISPSRYRQRFRSVVPA